MLELLAGFTWVEWVMSGVGTAAAGLATLYGVVRYRRAKRRAARAAMIRSGLEGRCYRVKAGHSLTSVVAETIVTHIAVRDKYYPYSTEWKKQTLTEGRAASMREGAVLTVLKADSIRSLCRIASAPLLEGQLYSGLVWLDTDLLIDHCAWVCSVGDEVMLQEAKIAEAAANTLRHSA